MNPKLADFNQNTIALLRLIYIAPGLNSRVYTFTALLRPLVNAKLIEYSGENRGYVNITPSGYAFLREHKLDHFGFERRHLEQYPEQYPEQCANNAALMEVMMKFTGQYVA